MVEEIVTTIKATKNKLSYSNEQRNLLSTQLLFPFFLCAKLIPVFVLFSFNANYMRYDTEILSEPGPPSNIRVGMRDFKSTPTRNQETIF